MPNNNNERKFYTNIDGCQAVKKDGSTYARVEVECRVVGNVPEMRQVNGSDGPTNVITLNVPIENRGKSIEYLTGTYPEEKDGTAWANVTFWGQDADRVKRALDAGVKYIHVNGSIYYRDYNDRNGAARKSLEIRVFSFYAYNKATREGGNNAAPAPAASRPAAAAAPAAPAQQQNYQAAASVFSDLDDPDGDLPF